MKLKNRRQEAGVALIEVMVAILIMSLGVVGALGLQTKSLAAASNAGARGEAVMAAERLLGIVWNDQANLNTYVWAGSGTPPANLAVWVAETRTLLPSATFDITVTSQLAGSTANQIGVTINWRRRSTDPLNTHRVTATLATAT